MFSLDAYYYILPKHVLGKCIYCWTSILGLKMWEDCNFIKLESTNFKTIFKLTKLEQSNFKVMLVNILLIQNRDFYLELKSP